MATEVNYRMIIPIRDGDPIEMRYVHVSTEPSDRYKGDREISLINDGTQWSLNDITYQSARKFKKTPIQALTYDELMSGQDFYLSDYMDVAYLLRDIQPMWEGISRIHLDFDQGEWKASFFVNDELTMGAYELFQELPDPLEELWMTQSEGTQDTNISISSSPEEQVESIIAQLNKDPQNRTIIFNGNIYIVGKDNIATDVNEALRNDGSTMRLSIAGSGITGDIVYYYGPYISEEKFKTGDGFAYKIYVDTAQQKSGVPPNMLAFTDNVDTVFVIKDHVTFILGDNFHERSINPIYPHVHEQVYRDFESAGGVDEYSVAIMSELVSVHEKGHYLYQERYGEELRVLKHQLHLLGIEGLHDFEELYADLMTVSAIAELGKKDPESAMAAYRNWAIFRRHGGPSLYEEVVSDIMLSCAQVDGGHLRVDWDMLLRRSQSLLGVLDGIFTKLRENILLDMVDTGPDLEQRYKQQLEGTTQFNQEIQLGTPPETAEALAMNQLISEVLKKTGADGRAKAITFAAELLSYAWQIDEWMRTNLGLNDKTVPYKAPHIEITYVDEVEE